MRQRWISAVVAIPIFLGLVFWGTIPFAVAILLLAAVALGEMLRAYEAAGINVNLPIAVFGMALPAWAWIAEQNLPLQAGGFLVTAGVLWLLVGLLWEVVLAARSDEIHAGSNVAYGLLCGVYVSLISGLVWLRSLPGERLAGPVPVERGVAALLLPVFCVWATDSFALFVGKAAGKHKLAVKLSPGKTVEGALGGLLFALLFGAFFGWLFFRNVALGMAVGAVAGIIGQLGDLFKSALKRELGIKDFGGVLPGHGGVLDRFDSLLFVGPLTALLFYYWPT